MNNVIKKHKNVTKGGLKNNNRKIKKLKKIMFFFV